MTNEELPEFPSDFPHDADVFETHCLMHAETRFITLGYPREKCVQAGLPPFFDNRLEKLFPDPSSPELSFHVNGEFGGITVRAPV